MLYVTQNFIRFSFMSVQWFIVAVDTLILSNKLQVLCKTLYHTSSATAIFWDEIKFHLKPWVISHELQW